MTDIVPYSVVSVQAISRMPHETVLPGQAQGVYIMFTTPDIQFFVNKMVGWFRDRDEVDLVDHGVSDKLGCGYIILEWFERPVDQLFCDILRDEEAVGDYTVYTRDLN